MIEINLLINLVIPPILGSTIGYITNMLAIKMLFKPHKSYYIFKIKIPFTPGIIPKNRQEIAKNIAELVSKLLLNTETIKKQINSIQSQNLIKNLIKTRIKKLEEIQNKPIHKLLSKNTKKLLIKPYNKLKAILKSKIKSYLKSNNLKENIENIISNLITNIENKKIKILPMKNLKEIIDKILSKISQEEKLKENLNKLWSKIENNEKSLNNYIPKELTEILYSKVSTELPNLIEQLKEKVFNSKMHIEIHKTISKAIYNYIKQLGSVQQFIVNAWGIEEKVEKDLPPLISQNIIEIFDKLKNKEKQKTILTSIEDSLNKILSQPIKILLKDKNKSQKIKNQIISKILNYIRKNSSKKYITLKLMKEIKKLNINNLIKKENLIKLLTNLALNYIQKENNTNKIISQIIKKSNNLILNINIKSIKNQIISNENIENQIISNLTKLSIKLINKEINNIMKILDTNTTIINKINQFPVKDVEKMLLLIIKKHLKWLNIFGAILGLIISSIQYFL